MKHIVFDCEIFANRFLFCGRVLENRNLIVIWGHQPDAIEQLREVMNSPCTFVSFNGYRFDLPVISAFLSGMDQGALKKMSNDIIEKEIQPWQVYRKLRLKELEVDHIDLIDVAPGTFSSLKAYGSRMHTRWLKDIPFEHNAELTDEQCVDVEAYCVNDLDTTEELFNKLSLEIQLRVDMGAKYDSDFRSKSDSQMAEAVFVKKLNMTRAKSAVPYHVNYKIPHFVHFDSLELTNIAKKIEEHDFLVDQATGHVIFPAFLKEKIKLNSGEYQMGVGGLHSTHDKKVCHVSSDDYIVMDLDAASYYPMIAILCKLIPQNTGEKFIQVYKEMIDQRLEAKRLWKDAEKVNDEKTIKEQKSIADTLRIAVNGTFGKTASRWSPLYSPDLMIAITITGQLTLLSLIEKLEAVGVTTLSANTDGIALGGSRVAMERVLTVVGDFETMSGFEFEYTPYRVLAMKDVNNYIAVKRNRKVKAKGIYAQQSLSKNPNAQVCSEAVSEWLANGTPFMDTIQASSIEGFLSARSVTGGGAQGSVFLGRVVRWYNSTDKSLPPLTYVKNGNKVPKTDGARAYMVIDKSGELPDDLDYQWYYKEAISIATNVGAGEFLTEQERQLIAPPPKVKKTKVKS